MLMLIGAQPELRAQGGRQSGSTSSTGRATPTPLLVVTAGLGGAREWFSLPSIGTMGTTVSLPASADYMSGSVGLSGNIPTGPASRFALGGAFSGSAFYDPQQRSTIEEYLGEANASMAVTKRTTVTGDFSARVQPLSLSTLFPGATGSAGPASALVSYLGGSTRYVTRRVGVGATYMLTRRASVNVAFGREGSSASHDPIKRRTDYVSGRFGYNIGRGLGATLGYSETAGRYEGGPGPTQPTVRQHGIEAGLNFSRSLSFSRRTSLSFGSGTAAVSDGVTERFDVVGRATLDHQWGRSWQTSVGFSRQLQFVDALVQPTFSNSYSWFLDGRLSGRVAVAASAALSDGSVGLVRKTNNFRAVNSSSSLSAVLGGPWSASLTYYYGSYRFDATTLLPGGVATDLDRHSVSVGINWMAPLFSRVRRSNVAR
jgi:hypothetical protein